MAFPTAVNDQITDSVTQSNVKVIADAPAVAMSNIYQATAQALSNAAHNATTAQQQTSVTAQAALTQGIATLYSIDTASTAAQFEKSNSSNVKTTADNNKSCHTEKDQHESINGDTSAPANQTAEIGDSLKQQAEVLTAGNEEIQQDIKKSIEAAITFALDSNLGSADRFNHAVREVMDAFVSSLQAIAESEYRNSINTVKIAATIQALQAMLAFPDKHDQYAKILETVREL